MEPVKKTMISAILCLGLVGCLERPAVDGSGALDAIDIDAESVDAVIYSLNKATEESAVEDSAASLCGGPAAIQDCVSAGSESHKIAEFDSCYIEGTRLLARGFVNLHYNNPSCSIGVTGDVVNRTYDVSLSNPLGETYRLSSESKRNYLGETLGGGGYLENTPTGWRIEVDGRHEEFYSRRGRKLMDISIETGAPIEVEGSLARHSRLVTSGQLLVHHNLAKFTASYASRGLSWQQDCLCPVSGTLLVDYANRAGERGAEITFQQCGLATIQYDNGRTRELRLRRCLP